MLQLVGRMFTIGFAFLAGLGLAASAIVHVASLAGTNLLGDGFALMWLLHGGVFFVFVPMMLAAFVERLRKRHAPFLGGRRANLAAGLLLAYVVANFVWCMFQIKAIEDARPRDAGPDAVATGDPLTARAFSGHWLLFYFVAFAYFGRRALPEPMP
jgi:hypothetical protein